MVIVRRAHMLLSTAPSRARELQGIDVKTTKYSLPLSVGAAAVGAVIGASLKSPQAVFAGAAIGGAAGFALTSVVYEEDGKEDRGPIIAPPVEKSASEQAVEDATAVKKEWWEF